MIEFRPGDVQAFALMRGGHNAVFNWLVAAIRATGRSVQRHDDCRIDGCRLSYHLPHSITQEGVDLVEPVRAFNFDDFHLDYPATPAHFAAALGPARRVLILRDPFNTFASRLFMGRANGWAHPDPAWDRLDPSNWLAMAREAAGWTHHLGAGVCLSFNAWSRSGRYRGMALRALGLRVADPGVGRLSRFGGGSTFDGTAHDANPGRQDLHGRWTAAMGDPAYRHRIVGNPELRELAAILFPLVTYQVSQWQT